MRCFLLASHHHIYFCHVFPADADAAVQYCQHVQTSSGNVAGYSGVAERIFGLVPQTSSDVTWVKRGSKQLFYGGDSKSPPPCRKGVGKMMIGLSCLQLFFFRVNSQL